MVTTTTYFLGISQKKIKIKSQDINLMVPSGFHSNKQTYRHLRTMVELGVLSSHAMAREYIGTGPRHCHLSGVKPTHGWQPVITCQKGIPPQKKKKKKKCSDKEKSALNGSITYNLNGCIDLHPILVQKCHPHPIYPVDHKTDSGHGEEIPQSRIQYNKHPVAIEVVGSNLVACTYCWRGNYGHAIIIDNN